MKGRGDSSNDFSPRLGCGARERKRENIRALRAGNPLDSAQLWVRIRVELCFVIFAKCSYTVFHPTLFLALFTDGKKNRKTKNCYLLTPEVVLCLCDSLTNISHQL